MKHILKTSILSVAAMLAIGAAALPASARHASATSGSALPVSDAGCFSEFYGALTNTCGSDKILRFSPQIDGTGWKNVTVWAQGAGPSNNVQCQAISINVSVTSYFGSPTVALPQFGSTQALTFGTWLPEGFVLFANCFVMNGGRVNAIAYDI